MASLQLLLCCATTLLIANALELTPQLLSAASNEPAGSKPKTQYSPFPLVDDEDDVNGVEPPLDVEQEDNVEPTRFHHSLPPPWLQFAEEPVQKTRVSTSNNNKASFIKQHGKHPHEHGHGTCTIEVTSKVPGICQPMRVGVGMGSTCTAGELMEVYSTSHCSNF